MKTAEYTYDQDSTATRSPALALLANENIKSAAEPFKFSRRIHLGDTNAFQNVYFAQFFQIMGEAREELLLAVMRENLAEMMQSGILLLTRDCDFKFRNSLFAFDEVEVSVSVAKLTRVSVGLKFQFFNKTRNQIAGEGNMTIACAKGNKIGPLPELLYQRLKDMR